MLSFLLRFIVCERVVAIVLEALHTRCERMVGFALLLQLARVRYGKGLLIETVLLDVSRSY